jgi:hypothetical protein
MLTRPADLSDLEVVEALRTGWLMEPAGVEYSAVGFGSHHWRVADGVGRRWFLSIDDLVERRRLTDDLPSDAYDRLRAALLTARALEDSGAAFVVAPVMTTDGDVVQRIRDRYVAALYPWVDGRLREFGETFTNAERDAVLRMIGVLHGSTAAISEVAQVEDFVLPQRDEIVAALDEMGTPWDTGPYGQRTRSWLAEHASRIEQLLAEHEQLADQARQRPDRMVLTHGEPHPGNLIDAPGGWMLVDWDTALLAPPERDLWHLQGTAPSSFDAYISTTGRAVLPPMFDFYRLSWELDDVASFVVRFRRAHGDTADARAEWANMEHRSLWGDE